MSAGKGKKRWKEALECILSDLTNYADYHFVAEEKEMLSKVKELKGDYKQG